jgi:hypothetical protein
MIYQNREQRVEDMVKGRRERKQMQIETILWKSMRE